MQRKIFKRAIAVILSLSVLMLSVFTGITVSAEDTAVYEAERITIHPGIDETRLNFSWHSEAQANPATVRIKVTGTDEWVVFTGESAAVKTSESGHQDGYHDTFVKNCGHTCSDTCGHPACSSTECYHGTYAKPYYNRVTVSGLEFGKEYTYQLGDGTAWSKEYATKTADTDPDEGFEYLVFGDSQTADQYYGDYMKKALELATERFPEADFMMNLGDNIHENNDRNYNAYFTSKDILAQFPIAVVMGNHELNIGALENHPALTFTNPPAADARQDYWFRYGDTLFITFNSGPQKTSMMEDLDNLIADAIAAHPDARWKILQTHQGFYSNNGGGKVWRRDFVPVISKYDIDMVFVGHHHLYTRTESLIYDSALTCTHKKGEPVFDCSACSGYIEELGENDVTVDEVFVATDGTETQYKKTTERTDPKGITYMHLDSLTAEGHDQYYTGSSSLAPTSAYSVNTISGQGAISKVTVTKDALKVETYWINNNDTPRIGNSADIALLDDDYIDEQPYDSYTIHKTSAVKEIEVTFDGGSDRGISTKRINAGETVTEPEAPIYTGKSFQYWTLDGETEFDFTTPITEDTTLTAVYGEIPATTTVELFKEAVARGDSEIILASDITLPDEGEIMINSNTVIKSAEGQKYTLTLDGSSRLTVAAGKTVTFKGINVIVAATANTMNSDTAYYNGYITVRSNAKLYVYDSHIEGKASTYGSSTTALIKIYRVASNAGYVHIEDSTVVSTSTAEKGVALNGIKHESAKPTFRIVNSSVSGNWVFYGAYFILEGTTTISGYTTGSTYDFRNVSVKAARNSSNLIELSKIGTGANATNDAYKIYYSLDEKAFENGTAIEYTEPIADVDFTAPIYVAVRTTGKLSNGNTATFYSTPEERYCGEYIEGVAVATADALVAAIENGESVITLTADIELTDQILETAADTVIQSKIGQQYVVTLKGTSRIVATTNKTLTLKSVQIIVDENAATIDDGYWYGYITVQNGAKLNVYDSHIEGKAANYGSSTTALVRVTHSDTNPGNVYIENSTIVATTTPNGGGALNGTVIGGVGPLFHIVDTSITGDWIFYEGDVVLEGTSNLIGNAYTHNAKIYNFANTKVRATRNTDGNIVLTKKGTGVAVSDSNYKIYYSLNKDFTDAVEYTAPITDIDTATPIYVAVTDAASTYYSTPVEWYCGSYADGIEVSTAEEFMESLSYGDPIISLAADITLDDLGEIIITSDTVIKSKSGEQFAITLDGSTRLTVAKNITVTFDGIKVYIAETANTISSDDGYYYGYITIKNGSKLYIYDSHIESKSTNLGSSQTAMIKIYRESPTNGYVYIENSTIVSPSGQNKGVALNGVRYTANSKPTFRIKDSTLNGNWVFHGAYIIMEGTTTIKGVGYSNVTGYTYDFRNSSLAGTRSLSGKITLSKIGSGAAVTNENYKIYYSTDKAAFANGAATEYTAPVEGIGKDTPIYVAIGYTVGSYLCYSTPVECEVALMGDIDNDGIINAADLVPLRKYLLGTYDGDMSAADVNGDGAINLKDLVCLKKSVAGIN